MRTIYRLKSIKHGRDGLISQRWWCKCNQGISYSLNYCWFLQHRGSWLSMTLCRALNSSFNKMAVSGLQSGQVFLEQTALRHNNIIWWVYALENLSCKNPPPPRHFFCPTFPHGSTAVHHFYSLHNCLLNDPADNVESYLSDCQLKPRSKFGHSSAYFIVIGACQFNLVFQLYLPACCVLEAGSKWKYMLT